MGNRIGLSAWYWTNFFIKEHPKWSEKLTSSCHTGTGHGVGAGLNVHEGPQSISARFGNMTALECGMIVSNEPGYYEDRSFGIRIEVIAIISPSI